jgi:hypothetical protein
VDHHSIHTIQYITLVPPCQPEFCPFRNWPDTIQGAISYGYNHIYQIGAAKADQLKCRVSESNHNSTLLNNLLADKLKIAYHLIIVNRKPADDWDIRTKN